MARPKLDIDGKAKALVYAEMHGDEAAAREYGITLRTLQRYRKQMSVDPDLSQSVAYMTAEVKEPDDWASRATRAIRALLDYFERASRDASTADPDTIAALAAAHNSVSETLLAIRILDEQASAQAGADAHEGRPDDVPDAVIGAWGSNGSAPRATA